MKNRIFYQLGPIGKLRACMLLIASVLLYSSAAYGYAGSEFSGKIGTDEIIGMAQQKRIKITGTVYDADTKETLPGADVFVAGGKVHTVTDIDGNFTLEIPADVAQIEVAYSGYKQQSVNVQGKSKVAVYMHAESMLLEQLVVTGAFTRRQNTYTGAITAVKSDDLIKTGTINVIQALSTLDPSFVMIENNLNGSNPNALPDLQLRGAGSFTDMKNTYSTSPNQPLFIVDGFEQSLERILDMDMNRVESVNVLKDATAKAIYGAKAANGVIVIETKTPEEGKLKVSYKGEMNVQAPVLSSYNLLNSREKLELEKLAGVWSSTDPYYQMLNDQEYNELYKEVLRGVDTDWLAIPTRVGVGHKHSLNFEGGDNSIRYNVNVAYNDVAGVMKGSNRKTLEGGFNLQYRYKNLLFKEQFTFIDNVATESPYGNFSDYAKMNPYYRPYDENGNINRELGGYSTLQSYDVIYNPMLNAYSNYKDESRYTDFTNNFYIEYAPFADFKAIGRIGITKRKAQDDLFYPNNYTTLEFSSPYNYISVQPDDPDDAYFKRGLYQQTLQDMMTMSADITLNYSKQIKKHLVFLNAQYNVSTTNNNSTLYEGIGFPDNATEITQALQYRESSKPSGYENRTREMGFIASVNYSYDSRYLFDANYRASASSLFGANNKWGHFWSVGAGWNVHNESFMKNADWLDQLKIRGSFGYTGSHNFSSYQAIATYSFFNNDVYDNVVGAYLMAMHNPDLKWQLTEDFNIGVDMTLFKRLDLTVDYYEKNTSNLLTPITAAPSMGFSTFVENLGDSRNYGVEGKINLRILNDSKRDIFLSVFGSAAWNVNTLESINDALTSINDATNKEFGGASNNLAEELKKTKPRVEYAEGVSLSAIWAVPSLGIDPLNGEEIFIDRFGNPTYDWSVLDKRPMGDSMPKVQGTFGVNFDYKGFSVNAILGYKLGGQYYNSTLVEKVECADVNYNVDERVLLDRWNTPGVAAKYKALTMYNQVPTRPTSRFIQDFDELKMTSLNVGYDFRNCAFMKRGKSIERLKFSVAMNDLFRISTVKTERGTYYPYAQSFIFSAQITF